jgi:ABC-type transporter Mla subunit MlaD
MSAENLLEPQEALSELKTLIEELKALGGELKERQERLRELLAPSEAALKERTGYLDGVIREQLAVSDQRVTALAQLVGKESARSTQVLREIAAGIAASERQFLRRATAWRIAGLIGMGLGGYLALWVAASRLPANANAPGSPAAVTSASPTKAAPRPQANPTGAWPKP